MLDQSHRTEAIDGIVAELAITKLCIDERPEQFEARILEVATTYDLGVTNVMGQVSRLVAVSDRFNPTRRQRILSSLRARGVGMPEPALRRF